MPGATCFVTTTMRTSLATHSELALWQDVVGRAPQPHKTWIALAILAAVIVAASFGLLAVELAAFTGAVLMVLTGVLTPRSAVRALDWNVLFVLAGSIGLGAIVREQRTGRRPGGVRSSTCPAATRCSSSSCSRSPRPC